MCGAVVDVKSILRGEEQRHRLGTRCGLTVGLPTFEVSWAVA